MFQPYKKQKDGGKKSRQPCKYFLRGRCANKNCPYAHVREGDVDKAGGNGHAAATSTTTSSGGGSAMTPATSVLSTMLKLFFEKQQAAIYDADQRTLDLSALAEYDDLRAVASSVNFNTRAFCEALWACVRDMIAPPPTTLLLRRNHIHSVFHLAHTMEEADLHLSLRALSLADNDIRSTDAAAALKAFVNLTEVDLRGNAVVSHDDYTRQVKKHLPFLLGLDGQSIVAAPLLLPWPRFYRGDANSTSAANGQLHGEGSGGVALPGDSLPALSPPEADRVYEQAQRNVLQFVRSALLTPLEMAPSTPGGGGSRVDLVTDVYAPHAVLTLSLSSTDAAASTPAHTARGSGPAPTQRDVIRDIVGLRLRQTEGNHNLMLGIRSTQVAIGRTRVCAQLEHWLYPRNFAVTHYVHPSVDVALLDNLGFGPNAVVGMKQPLSVVTMHGVMMWRYCGSSNSNSNNNNNTTTTTTTMGDAVVVKRNFTRVLTVSSADAGRWQIVNDMVMLLPFRAAATAMGSGSSSRDKDGSGSSGLVLDVDDDDEGVAVFFRDVHACNVVFSPASDARRAARLGRKYAVPEDVVATLCRCVHNDRELVTILLDLKDVPLEVYAQLALLTNADALATIFLARLGNRYGVAPADGLQLLQQHGLDWLALEAAVTRASPPT